MLSVSYDILVNYLDCHEHAMNLVRGAIDDEYFIEKIENEVKRNTNKALKFMDEIEIDYREITKAIQQRRAEYYLLSHQYSFIQSMAKKGQIEEKQCQRITSELDEKIF